MTARPAHDPADVRQIDVPLEPPLDEAGYFAPRTLAPGLPACPRFAIGAAGLGGVWGPTKDQASIDILHDLWGKGFLLTDAAPAYSEAERLIGEALRTWTGPDPVLLTKLEGARGWEVPEDEPWAPALEKQVQTSSGCFGRMPDGLAMHDADISPPSFESACMAWLTERKAQGDLAALGVGGGGPEVQRRALETGQVDYILTFKRLCAVSLQAMTDVVPAARLADARVLVGSATFMGLLGGKFDAFRASPPRHIAPVFVQRAIALNDLADRANLRLSQLALRFVLSVPSVDFVLNGAGQPASWADSLEGYEAGPLPADLYADVWAIAQQGPEPPTGG